MVLIQNLHFSYPKKPTLFKGLTMNLEKGKVIGLLGKNGAGKSTLMRLMAGLLKPNAGTVVFEGKHSFDRDPDFLDQMIFVSEQISVPEFLKVKDYVGVYRDFYSRFDDVRLENLLAEFQISTEEKISNMSYGQQKKLQLAISLSVGAKLILLDEPTNGLDIPSKSSFKKVVSASLEEDQILVISTHQVQDIEHLIDQVIILDEGKIKLHADLEVLEEEFVFSQSGEMPANAIYGESHVLGARFIAKSMIGISGGSTDLELLFHAVIADKLNGNYLSHPKPQMS
ncbi:ABC transporter ATP-binding protein [Algoriphagus kandeliae]|nr:ABC transporter ATP-binding protein [Algoriphagus kandeliae]